jgi:hypothetical protein
MLACTHLAEFILFSARHRLRARGMSCRYTAMIGDMGSSLPRRPLQSPGHAPLPQFDVEALGPDAASGPFVLFPEVARCDW